MTGVDVTIIQQKVTTLSGEEIMAPPRKTTAEEITSCHDIIRKRNAEILELRKSVKSLQSRADTHDEIRQKYFGLGEYDPTPPAWVSGKHGKIGSRGCPITIWSDPHAGETVNKTSVNGFNEFNKDICKKRFLRLFDTTVDLCYNHMGRAKQQYPGIIVCLGGDMVSGDIHDELMRTNDLPPLKAVEFLSDILCGGLEYMASKFGKVYVPAVVGNHARTLKKPPYKQITEFNYDFALYCKLMQYVKNTKQQKYIHIDAPETADLHFRSYGTNYMLTHGDNLGVKGGEGIIGSIGPVMRGSVKLGQQTHKIGQDFDELVMGHWHRMLWLPGVTVNNSLKGYDEYAALALRAPPTRPSQALWFNHPDHGTTARWEVYLEGKQPAAAMDRVWASWTEN